MRSLIPILFPYIYLYKMLINNLLEMRKTVEINEIPDFLLHFPTSFYKALMEKLIANKKSLEINEIHNDYYVSLHIFPYNI